MISSDVKDAKGRRCMHMCALLCDCDDVDSAATGVACTGSCATHIITRMENEPHFLLSRY